ncbi:MAG: hypothetical protein FH749_12185 [Firmicutes bacterium]|nr:hypothetical protein [Bacillota bacterium]
MRISKFCVAALMGLLVIAAPGCGDDLPIGGVFSQAVVGEPTHLNPLLSGDRLVQEVAANIYEPLLTYDEEQQLAGVLAQSWSVSDDGLSWTVHLKEDVLWHDGEPFTASDVAFTFSELRRLELDGFTRRHGHDYLDTVTVANNHTVIFKLTKPFGPFVDYLMIPVLPRHLLAEDNHALTDINDHPLNREPVGTGPWQLEDWQPGDYLQLERNTGYHQAPLPYLETIYYRFVENIDVALAALVRGDVNMVGDVPADKEAIYNQVSETHSLYAPSSGSYWSLGFNHRAGAFGAQSNFWRNKSVRAAVAHAIDRQALVDTHLHGHGTILDSPISPASWAYAEDTPDYEFDPATARELLETAGWELTDDSGIRARNVGSEVPVWQRLELTLTYPSDNPLAEALVVDIEQYLEAVGFGVELHPLANSELLKDSIIPGDYHLALLNWALTAEPDPYELYHSGAAANYGGYNNSLVDELIMIGREKTNPQVRLQVYRDLQHELAIDLPSVFLFAPQRIVIVSSDIEAIAVNGFDLSNCKNWYFAK